MRHGNMARSLVYIRHWGHVNSADTKTERKRVIEKQVTYSGRTAEVSESGGKSQVALHSSPETR